MKYLIFLLHLGSYLCVFCLPGEESRIVGGTEAQIEDFPYIVSIEVDDSFICGGSILSGHIIVTAGHCVNKKIKPSRTKVRVGANFIGKGGALYPASQIYRHKNYVTKRSVKYPKHDIALIILRDRIKFSRVAQPIDIATTLPTQNSMVSISGWGDTVGRKEEALPLRTVKVPLVEHSRCQIMMEDFIPVLPIDVICAGGGTKDSCQGDSGGPAVYNNELIGIVSFGFGCATVGLPGVYTDAVRYRSWIHKVSKQAKHPKMRMRSECQSQNRTIRIDNPALFTYGY